ncbi:SIR2 family NAD-dependent protein deacylase [Parachitinimonas caeni]|uniref:NAD-dependent protein deacylase n=1 Tax=Parachitinimonas caeni TaxID=3031301 RepID=A0ABT7E0D9_9NEIS|nr:NAD-dependent deacylase [Parachitinimonas caeni]MDK2125776.1 NAD-dependent deacylase [Parachitinimonas caeni]
MEKQKIVVFTGAGISAESGVKTFRDMGGWWREYSIEQVASPEGWQLNPEAVLAFYNERREGVVGAEPNAAHLAIAELESAFEVVVITQNVDDLHERGGSSRILHVHGEIRKARSTADATRIYPIPGTQLLLGDRCELGSQLRPHIVWFGEDVMHMAEATEHFRTADKVLVVGTSLTVYPAAGLLRHARQNAEKYAIGPEPMDVPWGYRFLRGTATSKVPHVVRCWLEQRSPTPAS